MKLDAEYTVSSFAELHEAFSKMSNGRWLFRGHSSLDWQLVPKAGRPPFNNVHESYVFDPWKRRAVEYVEVLPANDWDWLAIAQHHGLATRLLDWSVNPLAAAYFAVREPSESDACIYCYRYKSYVVRDAVDPLEFEGVSVFKPSAVARRISRQGGMFTLHGPATLALEDAMRHGEKLVRIVVAADYCKRLGYDLDFYGVSENTLFPDLDGLAAHVNWWMSTAQDRFASAAEDPDLEQSPDESG